MQKEKISLNQSNPAYFGVLLLSQNGLTSVYVILLLMRSNKNSIFEAGDSLG